MPIARHGNGPRAALAALASQVHPVFMLPPLAAAGFGAVLAGPGDGSATALDGVAAGTHVVAVFAAVYTAHVKDGYVDFYLRDEDDDHPLSRRGCRLALVGATVLFAACLLALWRLADPWAALLTLPCWIIAYNHAPTLDVHPLTATAGYPAGIALSMLGGYYVQTGTLSLAIVGFAAVFLVVLSGVKIVDDAQDYAYDRSIEKRTVAVAVGPRNARLTADGLMAVGMLAVVGLAVAGVFPAASVLAVLAFVSVAGFAREADSEVATMLLVRGSYVFLAVLIAAAWFRPLSAG